MNLLPKQQKDAITEDILTRFFALALVFLAFFAVIFLVFSYNIVLYLKVQVPALKERFEQESKTETSKTLLSIEEEFNELNKVLTQIQKARDKRSPNFPKVLRDIGELVPVGVKFRGLSFQGEALNITGHAEARTQALTFKANLEKDSICKNLHSPILVKEKDLDFTFTCTLSF